MISYTKTIIIQIVLTSSLLTNFPLGEGLEQIVITSGTEFNNSFSYGPSSVFQELDKPWNGIPNSNTPIWFLKSTDASDPPLNFAYSFATPMNDICGYSQLSIEIKYFSSLTAANLWPVNGEDAYFPLEVSQDPQWTQILQEINPTSSQIYIMGILLPTGYFVFDEIIIRHDGHSCIQTTTETPTTITSTEPTTLETSTAEMETLPTTPSPTTTVPTTVSTVTTTQTTTELSTDEPEPTEPETTTSEATTTDQTSESTSSDPTTIDPATSTDQSTESTTIDQTENTTIDQTESTTIDQTESTTIDQTESTTMDQTESSTIDQTESTTIDQTESTTIDQTESSTIDQTESTTIDQTESTTSIDPTKTTINPTTTSDQSTESTTNEGTTDPVNGDSTTTSSTTNIPSSTSIPPTFTTTTQAPGPIINNGSDGLGTSEILLYIVVPSVAVLSVISAGFAFAVFGKGCCSNMGSGMNRNISGLNPQSNAAQGPSNLQASQPASSYPISSEPNIGSSSNVIMPNMGPNHVSLNVSGLDIPRAHIDPMSSASSYRLSPSSNVGSMGGSQRSMLGYEGQSNVDSNYLPRMRRSRVDF